MEFEQRIRTLSEVGALPRQSVCFQFLMLLNLSEQYADNRCIEKVHYEGLYFFESVYLRSYMANVKSVSNSHKGIHALYEAGFVERLVLDKYNQKIYGDKFSRNAVKIYWRLTFKGRNLFS